MVNAATALAGLELLSQQGFQLPEGGVRPGLKNTVWPGRLEIVGKSPLVVLDGAHNPAAMEQLALSVAEHFRYRRLVLVLGILADKDKEAMFRHILPLAHRLVLTRPAYGRAASWMSWAHRRPWRPSIPGRCRLRRRLSGRWSRPCWPVNGPGPGGRLPLYS